jgi:hypothetical protein
VQLFLGIGALEKGQLKSQYDADPPGDFKPMANIFFVHLNTLFVQTIQG